MECGFLLPDQIQQDALLVGGQVGILQEFSEVSEPASAYLQPPSRTLTTLIRGRVRKRVPSLHRRPAVERQLDTPIARAHQSLRRSHTND